MRGPRLGHESDAGEAVPDEPDPAAILADVPAELWGELARAVRKAVDRVPRAELPRALHPYVGWRPERLTDDRPRQAMARSLGSDPVLREGVGAQIEPVGAYEAAGEARPDELVERYGEETAVAALVARGRWSALAVAVARAAERLAAKERAVAEQSYRRRAHQVEEERRRLTDDLATARRERDAQRRRADAAEDRVRQLTRENQKLQARATRLEEERDQLGEAVTEERRRSQRRDARARRRIAEAEDRARVDKDRARQVVADLEGLTRNLRGALDPAAPDRGAGTAEDETATVPRSAPSAVAGRPARLPPGIDPEGPDAVKALLRVEGLTVLVDGYNATKDPRGRPHLDLAQQRDWLVQVAGSVSARFHRPVVVVFDGEADGRGSRAGVRGVRVLFTGEGEVADDRLVELVRSLPDEAPAAVVTSDRDLQQRCAALGANVVSSQAFLLAVEG